MKGIMIIMVGMFVSSLYGATIAVIDSGTDLKHRELADHKWINPGEIIDNGLDDEKNGFKDDINGWNFAEDNKEVIDYSYLGTFSDDVYKFFDLQLKLILGTITDEEKQWMKAKIEDEAFVKEITKFANFIHGTHVAGIAVSDALEAKIMAIKLIPTEVKLPGFGSTFINWLNVNKARFTPRQVDFFQDMMIRMLLSGLVQQQMKVLLSVSDYVNKMEAQVANCSFGTGMVQARMVIEALLQLAGVDNPTEQDIEKYSKVFMGEMLKKGKEFIKKAPKTLFVLAAGNDGTNNDEFPSSPANVKADNTITVAATLNYEDIAVFSNYGKKMVEVAAPGVGIRSSIPGGDYLHISGTSQAAPYVADIAGQIMDINPSLPIKDVKTIIMGTVDIKTFLKGKVLSEGIVNMDRAIRAATHSLTISVEDAIIRSRDEVKDISRRNLVEDQSKIFVMPLFSPFKLIK